MLLLTLVEVVAILAVTLALLPVVAGLYQFLLVGLSYFNTHLDRSTRHLPRVSILIPAWNEDAVIATTIDRLMKVAYPEDSLRVWVIDDASTDETPRIVVEKCKEYPGRVRHIRRVAGGEGKAHTLNYGLDVLWKSAWTEAVLIMDADVIYSRTAIRKMARHLSDPSIGAVTAYIKEGSASPNLVQRFVTFEYITATGASRRAQNVLGFLACLSGGAQLHSRANMEAIGGQIFSATLAEDTFTTFLTQLNGRRAIFEPQALVYAEEPDSLVGLWKQRVRWGRGNVQITKEFRTLWFNRDRHQTLGSISMAMLWFSIFLMPVFQITASLSLITLYFMNAPLAWMLFRSYWIIAAVVYLLVTFISFAIDPESAKKSWREGFLFPGLVSLGVIAFAFFPAIGEWLGQLTGVHNGDVIFEITILTLYAWLGLSMAVAYSAKAMEGTRLERLAPAVLCFAGYGPFLCAVTFGSYMKELMGASMTWDKTVKTGKVS